MNENTKKVDLALEILKLAVERDEGISEGQDNFEDLFEKKDYPDEQVFRWLNCNLSMVRSVLGRAPEGRTARVVRRAFCYMTDPFGSHGYSRETGLRITGLEAIEKL